MYESPTPTESVRLGESIELHTELCCRVTLNKFYYLYLICVILLPEDNLHSFPFSPSEHIEIRTTMSAPKQATTDVAVEQQAAEQLHVEIIPGTEVMTDVGTFHLAKAGGNGSV